MMGTMNCTYETPCGWCTRWNKKCDEKIPERGLRVKVNPIDDYSGITPTNQICETESDHQWECCGVSTAGSDYRCKICGEHKTIPYKNQDNITISTYYHKNSDLESSIYSAPCRDCDNYDKNSPECIKCGTATNFYNFRSKENTK